jgi:4'-phosphopantetheinyl transferase
MANNAIDWPRPPTDVRPAELAAPGVHVWAASLRTSPALLETLARTLAPGERQRAEQFRFQRDRDRFVAGRGILRTILGAYVGIGPAAVALEYGSHGKPSLARTHGVAGLHFNLAHSEDLALMAVTRAGTVGIDVERVRRLDDAEDLVARFFSPRESAQFGALPPEQKAAAFFNLWTRKEAWLKATGEGIGSRLGEVEVSFRPGEPAELLSLPGHVGSAGAGWRLYHLAPAPGFIAALAIAAGRAQVSCWRWVMPGAEEE